MKSKKFHCLALMTKYVSKTMDMIDYLLVIRVNYKKSVDEISVQKSLFVKV